MDGETPQDPRRVIGFVGIYHANGSLWGELTYWLGARVGRAHCALCDITHGTFRRRPEWESCESGLGVPFETFHLDDRPADVSEVSGEATPCVLARLGDGSLVVLVGPEALERCAGRPEALASAIQAALSEADLALAQVGSVPTDAYTSTQSDVLGEKSERGSA